MYYILFVLISIILLYLLYAFLNYNFIELSNDNKEKMNNKLKVFEEKLKHDYPLGDDYFNIVHGDNYYAFFERLGDVHMNMIEKNNELIATACGVLRTINHKQCWYLCDLKVDPEYRGLHIPFKLAYDAKYKLNLCGKAYGITMNKPNSENKVIKLSTHLSMFNFKVVKEPLMIYSITYTKLLSIRNIIEKHRGPISFLSLENTKDLILKSTKKPMKILHIQYNDTGLKNPLPNYTYMFCCLYNDSLYKDLLKVDILTSTTASIIHHQMDDWDWRFILTSDI